MSIGDGVRLIADPTHSWLVAGILVKAQHRKYRIMNPHGHERTVDEDEIEPVEGASDLSPLLRASIAATAARRK